MLGQAAHSPSSRRLVWFLGLILCKCRRPGSIAGRAVVNGAPQTGLRPSGFHPYRGAWETQAPHEGLAALPMIRSSRSATLGVLAGRCLPVALLPVAIHAAWCPVGEWAWLLPASTHDATGLRADRRPSAACKKQTCRTIRCNSLSLAPCSSCGWVYATAGAIEYPTPCRQRGTRTTRTGRLYPAAEKAQAGKASTARKMAATSIVALRELRIIGTS